MEQDVPHSVLPMFNNGLFFCAERTKVFSDYVVLRFQKQAKCGICAQIDGCCQIQIKRTE
jgi:hypothetical protein